MNITSGLSSAAPGKTRSRREAFPNSFCPAGYRIHTSGHRAEPIAAPPTVAPAPKGPHSGRGAAAQAG